MSKTFDLRRSGLRALAGLEFSTSESEKIRATVQGMNESGLCTGGPAMSGTEPLRCRTVRPLRST